MFGNNKKEIADMQKQVDRAITDISKLQHDQELFKTNMSSLRGLINRKIGGDPEETKDIKSSVLLPNEHGLA